MEIELTNEEAKAIEVDILHILGHCALKETDLNIRKSIIDKLAPQPEYVPFTWEDRELFRGKWVRWKFENKEFTIDCIEERGLCFSGELFTWDRLFKDLEFIDGSVFGKLKP